MHLKLQWKLQIFLKILFDVKVLIGREVFGAEIISNC